MSQLVGHTYLTLVTDIDAGTVEYVADDRTTESLDGYFEAIPVEQRAGIQAVAMDMWQPYINSTHAHLPGAGDKIVFDRFHIMGYMGKAVDTVRKREHKALRAAGDDTLTKTKYLWVYAEENLPERHRERFEALRDADLKTARAWAIKENLRLLWDYLRRGWATRHWKDWYFWATHSRLQPVIDAARTIHRH
ncbi:MAG: transposase, partial [Longimicrobiales bacterium]